MRARTRTRVPHLNARYRSYEKRSFFKPLQFYVRASCGGYVPWYMSVCAGHGPGQAAVGGGAPATATAADVVDLTADSYVVVDDVDDSPIVVTDSYASWLGIGTFRLGTSFRVPNP